MAKNFYVLIIGTLFVSCNPKFTSESNLEMKALVNILVKDSSKHKGVSPTINKREIKIEEIRLGTKLPDSYKLFLTIFGNGAEWIYRVDQPINGVNQNYGGVHWLNDYLPNKPPKVDSDGFGTFETNKLLCLMTENSNGGAWVWITSENTESGEWPLAYYDPFEHKLYYKVKNFKEWIRIATECKDEVIRELDKEHKPSHGEKKRCTTADIAHHQARMSNFTYVRFY